MYIYPDKIKDLNYLTTSPGTAAARVELYIGENRLSSDMPIIQAIRQFSLPQDDVIFSLNYIIYILEQLQFKEAQESIPASIWVMPHTLYYKPMATPASGTAIVKPTVTPGGQKIPADQQHSRRYETNSPSPAVSVGESARLQPRSRINPIGGHSGIVFVLN
jgi:hypothetical protein